MIITRQLTDTASANTASDIQLGNCVTEIGQGAFSGYTNITDVELPDALTTIGASAFTNSSIRSIDIPSGVTTIGAYAFSSCGSLSSCTIGSGVTNIGNNVFYNCNSIKKINVPDSTQILGNTVFSNCQNLEECIIGSGITSIGNNIFNGCTNFSKVRCTAPTPPSITNNSFGDNNSHYQIYVPCESYSAYTGATNWTNYKSRIVCDSLPFKVKFYYADDSYGGLIPCDSSSSFDKNDINYVWNSGYTKIEIGDCVTTIGNEAFYNKSGITEVVWDTTSSSTITTIGNSAFNGLSNATFPSTLPPNVQTITSGSFNNCHLNNVTLNSGMTIGGGSYASDGAFNGSVINNLVYDVNTNVIGTFENATLSSLTIGKNVTTIPEYTFSGIKSLTALTIPNNVTSIGEMNFDNSNLVNVTIPATSIGAYSFRYSYNLNKINIDSGATFLGGGSQVCPFYGCSAVTTINSNEDGIANINNSSITSSMFSGMQYEELNLGSNVTSVGASAFEGCDNLKKIHIIGNSSTQIGGFGAFRNNSNLEEVVIDNCASYATDSFRGCPKLTKFTIGSGVTASNFNLSGIKSLKDVIYQNGSSGITNNAFSGCTSLSSVTMPNSITNIGNNAFYLCTSLGNVDIPSGATSIGASAFTYCISMTTLIIPDNVVSIGNNAFQYCSGLTSVLIGRTTPPTIGTNVFNGSSCSIYVPSASVELYKTAENWYVYADRIVGIGN